MAEASQAPCFAFVPNDKFDAFKAQLEGTLGSGCCHRLRIMG